MASTEGEKYNESLFVGSLIVLNSFTALKMVFEIGLVLPQKCSDHHAISSQFVSEAEECYA